MQYIIDVAFSTLETNPYKSYQCGLCKVGKKRLFIPDKEEIENIGETRRIRHLEKVLFCQLHKWTVGWFFSWEVRGNTKERAEKA